MKFIWPLLLTGGIVVYLSGPTGTAPPAVAHDETLESPASLQTVAEPEGMQEHEPEAVEPERLTGGSRPAEEVEPAQPIDETGVPIQAPTSQPAERVEPAQAVSEAGQLAQAVSEASSVRDADMGQLAQAVSEAVPVRNAETGQLAQAARRASRDGETEHDPQDPRLDAAGILRRAAAAYDAVTSLQASFVQRLDNQLLDMQMDSRGMLYQKQPNLFLMQFSEPEGDVIVSDGEHFWIYYPSVDQEQVMRAPVGQAGAVDLRAQFVGEPTERFHYTLEGRDTVADRAAYVLDLKPRQPRQVGYDGLRVWVDQRDFLVRRFIITEPNGVVRHIDLHDLRVNPSLSSRLFHFQPPPGARVIDVGG